MESSPSHGLAVIFKKTRGGTLEEPDLDAMQWVADPHADDAVAAILGDGPARLQRVDDLNRVIRGWEDNASVAAWRPDAKQAAAGLGEPLQRYVTAAQPLPEWAERDRIARAETMFM